MTILKCLLENEVSKYNTFIYKVRLSFSKAHFYFSELYYICQYFLNILISVIFFTK